MEIRFSLFRLGNNVPEYIVPFQSIGLQPFPLRTQRFHDLHPGTTYQIVAESDDDRQEVTFKTFGLDAPGNDTGRP
jgi:hypothetical protein